MSTTGWGLSPWIALGTILSTATERTAGGQLIKKVSKKLHMWVITTDTIRSHKKIVFWVRVVISIDITYLLIDLYSNNNNIFSH